MKGFLRRDWMLICINLKFYLLLVFAFSLLSIFTDFSVSYTSTYLMLFSSISIMNLFSYDEANGWEGYAAALPRARKAMVNARYALTILMGVGIMLFQFVLIQLSWMRPAALTIPPIYGGAFLCYIAIILPVFYRFGSVKSRMVLIFILAVLVCIMVVVSSVLTTQGEMPQFFLPLGIVGMLISWSISHAIVREKEF